MMNIAADARRFHSSGGAVHLATRVTWFCCTMNNFLKNQLKTNLHISAYCVHNTVLDVWGIKKSYLIKRDMQIDHHSIT